MFNEEGGAIPDEFLVEYCADRVETTSTVWLGLTLNCCRCHDHKFDPFTQRDYYSLFAFYHNVPEVGLGNAGANIGRTAPPSSICRRRSWRPSSASLNAELANAKSGSDASGMPKSGTAPTGRPRQSAPQTGLRDGQEIPTALVMQEMPKPRADVHPDARCVQQAGAPR